MSKRRTISYAERRRRSQQAKETLVPAAVEHVGQVGFTQAVKELKGKVRNPKKVAGKLKGMAKAQGKLSEEHPYVGRKKKRKLRRKR